MKRSPLLARALAIAILIIALDQASKAWIVLAVMTPPRVIEVTSFFNLVLTWNRGVSFGMFNHGDPLPSWVLPLIALAIVAFLLGWLFRADRLPLAYGLGAIVGGAIGNLIDRLRVGAVVDFLDMHVAGYHWPAFNIADSAITLGVVVLIVDSLTGPSTGRERRSGLGRETRE
ncbi:MAG: signal peptidase II [Rhodospirillales bacterium]|nr:signal peptidase II [Rhodospirillales bacterium]